MSDSGSEDLQGLIEGVRFTPTRLRTGYAMMDVDAFLDRVASAYTDGTASRDMLTQARFGLVKRGGYEMREVDDFLDRLGEALGGSGSSEAAASSAPEPGTPAEPVLAMIRRARFTTGRRHSGYDVTEVDDFLDRVAAAVRDGSAAPSLVAQARFRASGHGYQVRQVDDFLGQLAAALADSDAPAPESRPTAAERTLEAPDVIHEERGVISRLFGRGR